MPGNNNIDTPDDLRNLPVTSLQDLCGELRSFLIDHVATNGGHFSSSLGVVELTVALHYVFNTPEDKLVWDVGHQAYPHKLLTGRKSRFHSNRLLDGISGFPSRDESVYDAFGTGHSSTSISAILGMACTAKYRGDHTRQHIAVIGDGAMTAGMAFEALNNAGYEQPNMLVILNDNNMSIDANTGALQHYLTALTSGKHYNALKSHIRKLLTHPGQPDNWPVEVVRKLQKAIKGGLLRYSNLFEALNIRYFGPVDGHDLKKLIHIFEKLKHIPGPKLLHCVTTKGKGFAPAMTDQAKWHAPKKFDRSTGDTLDAETSVTFQKVFGDTLMELANSNPKIMAITPAMLSGSALTNMKKQMPERVFDVGITEQHAVTFSAGLAADGMIPFCTIYSTFLQRAYDQVIHDVALQKLDVVFCIDRAGVVGQDGPTHHGAFDISFLRCVPNIVGASPMDAEDFRNLLFTAQASEGNGPFAIRYPKGAVASMHGPSGFRKLAIGKGRKIRPGKDIAILSLGPVGQYVKEACDELESDQLHVAHYDLRFFKPLDEALLHEVFSQFSSVITVEDGCIRGGVGSAVLEFMVEHGYHVTLKRLGLPDTFATQGTQQQLHELYGYDKKGIIRVVRQVVGIKTLSVNNVFLSHH
ncbi:1-deoxy-D-xylulose-5-phosphate synthase [Chitinophaga sp. G-6-1-13]|uniref:1-deoxy-D-xylulose-5-phosphate synthase n=1 Tax=Chitinophaga fulva TaxID=2728842 RepID=A0A848GL54_9BACT|nr:1-deoxy-D-xylulose-5-phosphate synthase [Chitinophaga fulva]NML37732.1 1-deoxy-D-xylulose-5-phosphate synthase [Chitinophaga fulva]